MNRKKGKLEFKRTASNTYEVFLFRYIDKGKQRVKSFVNSESYIQLNGVDIEYLKFGKQLQLFEKGENRPFYDSTKPATAAVISKRKIKSRIVTKRPQQRVERSSSIRNSQPEKRFKGKNLFDDRSIKYSKLPKDVREITNPTQIDNFNLLLNKAVHFFEVNGSKITLNEVYSSKSEPSLFRTGLEDSRNKRSKFYFDISEHATELFKTNRYKTLISDCQERQLLTAKKNYDFLKSSTFSPDWRLIIGLGGASVYETSITLHHIYGIPYIPASSIKGTVRSHIIKEIFLPKYIAENDPKANEKAEEKAMKDPVFILFFGNQDKKGKLTFFDAFPMSPPMIEVDIMNPHYGDYYDGKSAPVDTLSPVPIPFLTVTGCDFQFLISSKEEGVFSETIAANGGNKTITQWLKDALQNHGIGAKTAVGYGYMTSK